MDDSEKVDFILEHTPEPGRGYQRQTGLFALDNSVGRDCRPMHHPIDKRRIGSCRRDRFADPCYEAD